MARDDRLTGRTLEVAEKMLRDVTTILENHGVEYFLDAGTLLGLVRENRLLPWDNDLDLAITEEFEERLLALRWTFIRHGYRLRLKRFERDTGPFKAGSIRLVKVVTRKFYLFNGHRLMDLYIKRPIGEELCWTEGSKKTVLKAIPKRFYAESAQLEFKGKPYSVPKDCEEFLAHHYGEDWRTPVKDWNFLEDDGCTKSVLE